MHPHCPAEIEPELAELSQQSAGVKVVSQTGYRGTHWATALLEAAAMAVPPPEALADAAVWS